MTPADIAKGKARAASVDEAIKLCATLTPRQRECVVLACQGLQSSEIAAALGIATKTVEMQRYWAFQRLGVNSMAQAAVLATKAGLT